MNISGKHIIIVVGLSMVGLWGYGYSLASTDLDEGLSLIEAGFTHKSLNPLSAMGYKTALNNSKSWQNHIKKINCERENRDFIESIYTYEKHGSNWYQYQKEALEKLNNENC